MKVDDAEQDWLFYLAQPNKLLLDIEGLTISHQLELLKQSLSQAEISERKTSLTNCENNSVDNFIGENETMNPDDIFVESSRLFKKSRVLDIMSLQIAANLKFNLNLFRVISEMPVKLLARLYRVLVMNTSRFSSVLQPLFEQATNKENIFIINPYGYYTWSQLNPMTIYGIMSYHIWCLHVSHTSSMLPHPFRNLTPIVSGLTEVPEVAFFADNRVEVGVVLTRIQESVNQLNEINSLLDDLNIARPLPSVFSTQDSMFSTVFEPKNKSAQEDQNHNGLSDFVLNNSIPLSKSYLSASLNFVLGRYAFQQQQFAQSQKLFQIAYDEMLDQKFEYLDEAGATPKLLHAYLTACKSYTSSECISDEFSLFQSDNQFLETFCRLLEVNTLDSHKDSINIFWIQPWDTSSSKTSVNMESKVCSGILTTIEDHLYQVLLNVDQFFIDDSSNPYVPISLGVRNKLESLCLKQLHNCISLLGDTNDTTRNIPSTKQSNHTKKLLSNDKMSIFNSVHQLFTKVHICNTVDRLMSESIELPLSLSTELLMNIPERNSESSTKKEHRSSSSLSSSSLSSSFSPPFIDVIIGREFLFDCLTSIIEKLSTSKNPNLSSSSQFIVICQYVRFLVQEGICLLGNLVHKPLPKSNYELNSIQKNYQDLLKTLVSHKLMDFLPESCRKYIQSISEAVNSRSSSETEINSDLFCAFIPDPLSDLPNLDIDLDSNLHQMDSDGLNSPGLGFWANYEAYQNTGSFRQQVSRGGSPFGIVGDVDMRSLANQSPSTSFPHMSIPQSHVTGGHGPFVNQPLQTLSRENPLVCDLQVIRHLLITRNPTDINMSVDYLLRSGMTPTGILELNGSWLPSLHYLASLEIVGPHPTNENSSTNSIDLLLSSSGNIMWGITVLIQLAKGSSIIRHEISPFTGARAFLLAALNNLASVNSIIPPPSSSSVNHVTTTSGHVVGKQSRLCDAFQWIRAGIRHELLLADLLEFLNPSSFNNFGGNSNQSHSGTKSTLHPGQVSLNDLIRRVKICLCYAAGLSSNANSLETKMESMNLIALSKELITAATCFLLMVKECDFLYPMSISSKSISLPSGSISFRVACAGSLDLIRILLHFHEVLHPSSSSHESSNSTTTSSSTTNAHVNSEKQNSNHPIKNILSATVKFGNADRLKTVINEFYGLIIHGCLVSANNSIDTINNLALSGSEQSVLQQQHQRSSRNYHSDSLSNRSGISLPTLYIISEMLATIDEIALIMSTVGLKFPLDNKRVLSNYPSIGLQLLDYLIIGFAQITHQINGKFNLQILEQVINCFNPANNVENIKNDEQMNEDTLTTTKGTTTTITTSTTNTSTDSHSTTKFRSSRWDKPKDNLSNTKKHNNSNKRYHSDSHESVTLPFLDKQLWILDLETNSSICGKSLCDHLNYFLNWALTVQPERIDWLILRGEIEFFVKNYRQALSTYLEFGSIVTDAFSKNVLSVFFTKELVFRMMCCLQYLGLFYESVVLSQFGPSSDESLMDNVIQIINSLGENSNGWPITQIDTFSTAVINQQPCSFDDSTSPDCLRGSCGGSLLHTTLDCPDNLIPYLWNIRLLSALERSASNRGALLQSTKFKARINNPELNANNPDEILLENRCALNLGYLRYLSNVYLI
uniref:Trafficking protein particle complex subunit 8 n=1 Tax=Schistosoma mansoni TaxID=6183 RepID=A0A3Q0KQ69_SCHMA